MEKVLLNLKEFCQYLGIGETKARELLTKTNNNYMVRIGNRLYANKILLDKWLLSNSGNRVQNSCTQRNSSLGYPRKRYSGKQQVEQETNMVFGMRM